MPEAVQLVFDLDGTLTDPAEGIWRCLNYALASFGQDIISREQVGRYVGPPLDDTFRVLAPGLDEAGIRAIVARYRERYAVAGFRENQIYPGISEALQALSARGVAMLVCTSKREDFARQILSMFGIDGYFPVVSGGDIGIKKSSQLQQLLQDGVVTADALMVGDRGVDMAAARANGLAGVGVLWGYGSSEELAEAGASSLLSTPQELLTLGNVVGSRP